jgi:hypothetical protein
MTRRFKIFALALSAGCLACAVLASAVTAQFETEATETSVSISSNTVQSFKTSAGSESTVTCTQVVAHTKDHKNLTSNDIHTTWTEVLCHEFLGQSTEFVMNGCGYTFHLADNSTEGTTDIECPTSTGIQIKVGSICTYELDSQTGLGTVKYVNKGTSSTRELELQFSLTGITSTRTTNDFPFLCPNGSSTGTYTGTVVETGSKSGSHVGIWVD